MKVDIVLFDHFETLDALGPIEIFGTLPDVTIRYLSLEGGLIRSAQGCEIMTQPIDQLSDSIDVLLIPGGKIAFSLMHDVTFIEAIELLAEKSTWCLTVCTGSVLLAQTGLLNGRKATSNKQAWAKVIETSDEVDWICHARWCCDEKYYSSSGISAGLDMSLGFIADRLGKSIADAVAEDIEYCWIDDPTDDPFSHSACHKSIDR